jgi:hypothetical protein
MADIIKKHFEEFSAVVPNAQRESFFAGAAAIWSVMQDVMANDTPQDECNSLFSNIDKEVQEFFLSVMTETAQAAAKKAGLNVEVEVVAERGDGTKRQVH